MFTRGIITLFPLNKKGFQKILKFSSRPNLKISGLILSFTFDLASTGIIVVPKKLNNDEAMKFILLFTALNYQAIKNHKDPCF